MSLPDRANNLVQRLTSMGSRLDALERRLGNEAHRVTLRAGGVQLPVYLNDPAYLASTSFQAGTINPPTTAVGSVVPNFIIGPLPEKTESVTVYMYAGAEVSPDRVVVSGTDAVAAPLTATDMTRVFSTGVAGRMFYAVLRPTALVGNETRWPGYFTTGAGARRLHIAQLFVAYTGASAVATFRVIGAHTGLPRETLA